MCIVAVVRVVWNDNILSHRQGVDACADFINVSDGFVAQGKRLRR